MLNKESNWVVTFSRMFFGSLFLFGIIILTGKINLILSLTSQQLIYIGVNDKIKLIFPVNIIIPNKNNEPKNILEKVTTQLLSLLSIAFFEMTFSTAQSIVADNTKKSPIFISFEIFVNSIKTKPNNIIPIAINCFFVIFSLRKINANIVA